MAGFHQTFMGHGAILQTANFAHSQLYNPAESDRTLFLTQVMFATDTVAIIQFNRVTDVILATLVRSGTGFDFGVPTASRAEIRVEDRVALVAGEFFATMGPYHAPVYYMFREPLALPPGTGLIVTHTMRAAELYVNYEWQESDAGYYAA